MADGRPLRSLRLWALLAQASFRGELQYRANFVFGVLGGLALQCAALAFIVTVLTRFHSIGGWTLAEMVLLYGIRLTAHGLWTVPCSQLLYIDQVVREAEFDRYLTLPMNPLIPLLTRRMPIATLGDVLGGTAILVTGAILAPVQWTAQHVGYLLFALVGGALVEGSCQLASSGLAFRFSGTLPLKLTLDTLFSSFGNYPLSIFGPAAQWAFTVVLPLAFAAYFPSAVLLDRTDELWVPSWTALASPAAGFVLILAAYAFWRSQIHRYSSSGT